MHILLRSEIEAGPITGDIAVADLPAIFAGRMRDSPGIEVPDDTRRVLQEVHWSHGYVGSFPTHAIGNIVSSQIFAAAERAPGVADGLERGDCSLFAAYLRDGVRRFGRSSSRDESPARVAGGPLDIAPCVADLTAKIDALTAARA